ncbi:hypothetical protein [Streptomyces sp. NPDC086989]|uniref:hypothetical protein n=1 Tax=Streptomyces sp. NPDC086989 TaxID=3365764 RepID=UPI00380CD184
MAVRCAACARVSEWPHPELGCASCGTVARIAVHPLEPEPGTGAPQPEGLLRRPGVRGAGPGPTPAVRGPAGAEDGGGSGAAGPAGPTGPGGPSGSAGPAGSAGHGGLQGPGGPGGPRGPGGSASAGASSGPVARPAFRPMTIRTARDAVSTAALYLRWLGFRDVRQPDARPIPSTAVDLRAPGLVAQVDPTTAPAGLRAVECVWLNGLTASATSVYFALAGYTQEARSRADDLGIPLFVMDLTGVPQPVNDPAEALVGAGA